MLSSFLRQTHETTTHTVFSNYLVLEVDGLEEKRFQPFRNKAVKLLSNIYSKAKECSHQLQQPQQQTLSQSLSATSVPQTFQQPQQPQGQENYGKEALVFVIVAACFLWLLNGNMLSIQGTYSLGDIPSGSELPIHPFPFIRGIWAVQVFILKFSKDGSADLEDEFADGGGANQPVIL